jgi:predicted TIM-barrel fold metal-dependent hydrolase
MAVMPLVNDPEGAAIPAGLTVVDAHVHLFPPGFFAAIWRWFDAYAWPIRYRLHAEQVVDFLQSRGIRRFCALHYAHKPGVARLLNRFVADIARAHPGVIPLATVLPGEPDAGAILDEALGPLSLRGVKIHCHVQRMGADDPRLDEVYRRCADAGRPVVIHAGREPSIPAYGLDTHALCNAARLERVLQRHPRLTLVVPHLGLDELGEYEALLDRYQHLWLDTTMAIGDYLPATVPPSLFPGHADRLLYGTDFPNIPYAWDRELARLLAAVPPGPSRDALLSGNALRLFD